MIKRLVDKSFSSIRKQGVAPFLNKVYVFFDKKIKRNKYFHNIAVPNSQKHTLFVSGEPINSTSYYRCEIPQEMLETNGKYADIIYYKFLKNKFLDKYSHIIFYRVPLTTELENICQQLKSNGKKIIYSIDDLLFDEESIKSQKWSKDLHPEDLQKLLVDIVGIRKFIENSDLGISSTTYLKDKMNKIGKFEDILVLPNSYKQSTLGNLNEVEWPGINNFGFFAGSETHDEDFELILPVLIELMERYDDLTLHLGGRLKYKDLEGYSSRIKYYPFASFDNYLKILQKCGLILNPLRINEHNLSKSEVRAVQCALVKRPIITTKIEAFKGLVEHKESGLLVKNNKNWKENLEYALNNDQVMKDMGTKLYHKLKIDYNPVRLGNNLTKFLEKYD